MIIISKFKDYYDYLQGIYGRDPKKILNRQPFVHDLDKDEVLNLYLCGNIYTRYKTDNIRIEYGFSKMKGYVYNDGIRGHLGHWIHDILVCENKDYMWFKSKPIREFHYKEPYFIIENINNIYVGSYPILKEIGFDKVMSAEEIYLMIEEWISYKEPDVNQDPTDMKLFESKGFDKKESFRNIK